MPVPINNSELEILRDYVDARDRSGYYAQLESWGYIYGQLAGGVVDEDSLSGRVANTFLAETALAKHSTFLTPEQAVEISLDLMERDFLARSQPDALSRAGLNLPNAVIEGYHESVFVSWGLSRYTWTATVPLELAENYPQTLGVLGYNGSDPQEARTFMWNLLLDAGDDGFPLLPNASTNVHSWVTNIAKNFDNAEARDWALTINRMNVDEALYLGTGAGSPFPPDVCFPAGTAIRLFDGTVKPIEEITLADVVLAHNDSGSPVPGEVSKLFTNTTPEFVLLSFIDGRDDLVATPGHRFLTETGDYMEIGHMLRLGGGAVRVVDTDGSIVEAEGELIAYSAETAHMFPQAATKTIAFEGNTVLKQDVEEGWQTYNFEVKDHHNYVAGVDVSRFDAAPLIAFIAAKETDYGNETDGRIPC